MTLLVHFLQYRLNLSEITDTDIKNNELLVHLTKYHTDHLVYKKIIFIDGYFLLFNSQDNGFSCYSTLYSAFMSSCNKARRVISNDVMGSRELM